MTAKRTDYPRTGPGRRSAFHFCLILLFCFLGFHGKKVSFIFRFFGEPENLSNIILSNISNLSNIIEWGVRIVIPET